jgi:hypothetical protein
MDQSSAREIVERDIEGLMEALGIPHWRITVEYGPIPGDGDDGLSSQGQCTRLIDYESAVIELDPARLDDEAHLLKILRHELFHVVLSPFDLMRSWMLTGISGAEHDRAMRVINHATERGVKHLERMWNGLAKRGTAEVPDANAAATRPKRKAKRHVTSRHRLLHRRGPGDSRRL